MFKTYLPIALMLITLAQFALFTWINDPMNQRKNMIVNEALMNAAQWKAEYLGQDGVTFAHCTEWGECPNSTIAKFGCKTNYDPHKNSVESLIKGIDNPVLAYTILTEQSPSHRKHLLAEIPFFQEQIHIGVGYSNFVFVFLSAKCL